MSWGRNIIPAFLSSSLRDLVVSGAPNTICRQLLATCFCAENTVDRNVVATFNMSKTRFALAAIATGTCLYNLYTYFKGDGSESEVEDICSYDYLLQYYYESNCIRGVNDEFIYYIQYLNSQNSSTCPYLHEYVSNSSNYGQNVNSQNTHAVVRNTNTYSYGNPQRSNNYGQIVNSQNTNTYSYEYSNSSNNYGQNVNSQNTHAVVRNTNTYSYGNPQRSNNYGQIVNSQSTNTYHYEYSNSNNYGQNVNSQNTHAGVTDTNTNPNDSNNNYGQSVNNQNTNIYPHEYSNSNNDSDQNVSRQNANAVVERTPEILNAVGVQRRRRRRRRRNRESREVNCTVCLANISGGCGTKLPCGHRFHLFCICQWLSENPSCPNCRKSVPFLYNTDN